MGNKKEQLEMTAALAIPNPNLGNVRVTPAAIVIAADDTSWTDHVTEHLTRTGVHTGEAIHPGKVEIGEPLSTEVIPSDCPSTDTLNVASTSEAHGTDRRGRVERRQSKQPGAVAKQPFPDIVNGRQGSSSVASGSVQSLLPRGHEGALATKIPLENRPAAPGLDNRSLVANDCDPINVCIVSNRENLLATLLPGLAQEPGIMAAGQQVGNPAQLLVRLEAWRPKLLLLDMALLDHLGTEWPRMIREKIPAIRILLIWDEVRPGLMDEILLHRIHGCLLTSCPHEVYVKAIRAVARGDLWLPRALLAKAFSDLLEPCRDGDADAEGDRFSANAMDALTKREQEIVGFLTQGLSNKQIARQLGIMEDTVKKHLQNIFRKFGVHRRTLVVLRQVGGQ